jgi:hypothetical protein
MSRIGVLNPQLQLVEPSSEVWEPGSTSAGTILNDWPGQTPWWSVLEFPRTLRCSRPSGLVESDGYPSLSSPFGSLLVH